MKVGLYKVENGGMRHENYTRGMSENKSKMEMFAVSCLGYNQHNQNMILPVARVGKLLGKSNALY